MATVLITGGSAGIGLELAKRYAADHHDLILTGRVQEHLDAARQQLLSVADVRVDCIAVDLSKPGSAQLLYQKVQVLGRTVDVLVNNAGSGYAGRSWQIPLSAEEESVILNTVTLMSLCKLYLAQMVKRHAGTVINVGSTGAFQPGPYIASYYASKAFVLSYSQAIAMEVREYGVQVYCFCPGPVKTAFYQKSGGHMPADAKTAAATAAYLYTHQKPGRVVIKPGFLNALAPYVPLHLRMQALARMKRKYLPEDDAR